MSKDTSKIIAIVFRPDGTSQVVYFKRDTELPKDFKLNGCDRVGDKDFTDVPKRFSFFLEKFPEVSESKSDKQEISKDPA